MDDEVRVLFSDPSMNMGYIPVGFWEWETDGVVFIDITIACPPNPSFDHFI